MDKEQIQRFEETARKVDEIYSFFESLKDKNIDELFDFVQAAKGGTMPVNDNQRVLQGLGFIGRTTDTTPAGGLIVNTPEGPITILRA